MQPRAFAERVRHFVEICGPNAIEAFMPGDPPLATRLSQLGPDERHLVQLLVRLEGDRPDLIPQLRYILFFYCQVRYLLDYYGIWDPKLAKREFPEAA